MILRIQTAEVVGPLSLQLTFHSGDTAEIDIDSLLDGPIFEPFRDPSFFARMKLDPNCGTVTWPNGADFAPESLLELFKYKHDR